MFKQLPDMSAELIDINFNGQPLQVEAGISVAAAILSSNPSFTRTTPVSGSKRAPFCMMGVCYDCLMVIDGQPNQRACSVVVQKGMQIEPQLGVGPAWENRQ